ncbi:MAG: 3-phosphoshikimate 1-carboxyvinyltransferase [Clostridia bacterium]|nr:3-phosphoshikimate 1-carboxyvinyltransferase [Clostridia bacterium]
MNLTIIPSAIGGNVRIPTSKSEAHRLLIAAALSALYNNDPNPRTLFVECTDTNEDIDATARCLCGLGANIQRSGNGFFVTPITQDSLKDVTDDTVIDCGESGSTLRFILPIIPALKLSVKINMHGRLPQRPLSPLYEELVAHGAELSEQGSVPLRVGGVLDSGTNEFSIRGDVSSQFVSGLLFALPLLYGNQTLTVTGQAESVPYIYMTLDAISKFTDRIHGQLPTFRICESGSANCSTLTAGGDWSGVAFWLAAGVIGKRPITVSGVDLDTRQGDAKIIDVLRSFGGKIEVSANSVTAYPSKLYGASVDATQIPDLVPIVATVAAVADGKTEIFGAARLRLKESDRLESVTRMLSGLGADILQLDDGLIINGKRYLDGGTVDSFSDHRIAMSAGVAATVCKSPVTVLGAQCVSKSYPAFWNDYNSLGGAFENE